MRIFSSVFTGGCKDQISLPSGIEVQKNYWYPTDTPILCYILCTFIQEEVKVLPEHPQQGKMLSCTFCYLS